MDGDARDDRTDVEGEDGGVHVYVVWVEDGRILGSRKDGIGKPSGERILVRAVSYIRQGKGEKPPREDGTGLVYLRAFAKESRKVSRAQTRERCGTPWKISVSFKNHSSQLPLN